MQNAAGARGTTINCAPSSFALCVVPKSTLGYSQVARRISATGANPHRVARHRTLGAATQRPGIASRALHMGNDYKLSIVIRYNVCPHVSTVPVTGQNANVIVLGASRGAAAAAVALGSKAAMLAKSAGGVKGVGAMFGIAGGAAAAATAASKQSTPTHLPSQAP